MRKPAFIEALFQVDCGDSRHNLALVNILNRVDSGHVGPNQELPWVEMSSMGRKYEIIDIHQIGA